MPSPPIALPDRISGWRSIAINGIIEFCESIFPHNSSTVFWQWTPGGLSAHVRPELFEDLLEEDITTTPWEIVIANDKRTKVTTPASGGMQVIRSGADADPVAPTAGTAAYATTYDLASIADDQYFFIKIEFDLATGADAITFEKNTTGFPNNDSDNGSGKALTYIPLWHFDWNAGASRITAIEDWRTCPQLNQRS